MSLPWAQSDNEYSEAGTRRHRLFEAGATLGWDAALGLCESDDERDKCEQLRDLIKKLDPLDVAELLVEFSIAINVDTGEARIVGKRREYGAVDPTCEVAGTGDLALVFPDRPILVLDWKGAFAEVEAPSENKQLRMLGYGLADVYAHDSIEIGIVRITTGELSPQTTTLDEFELDGVLSELREIHAQAQHAPYGYAEGKHCQYCPAFFGCPVKFSLAKALINPDESVRADMNGIGMMTPEEAGRVLAMWEQAREVVKRMGAALHAYAARTPIPVGNGKEWAPCVTSREKLDGKITREVMTKLHGPEVGEAACEWSTSKKAIDEALKIVAKATKKPRAHLVREAHAEIRKAGGITDEIRTEFEARPMQQGQIDDTRGEVPALMTAEG